MRRYFFETNTDFVVDQIITIDGDLFHHIVDVCRQHVGSHFELLNYNGNAFLCEILSVSKKSATLKVKEIRKVPKPLPPYIHLILSFPKVSTFETILEKSVELGVTSITPVISEFSFIKSLNNFPKEKESRWKKIILQATQQSARGNLLQLMPVITLKQKIESLNLKKDTSQRAIFAYEGECPLSLKEYLASFHKSSQNNINDIWIIVGSEGGFSFAEVNYFKEQDLSPVSLGQQVLRVETACLSLTSIIKYEFEK